MDLTNSFVVPADIDTTWRALQDVEALAPCMPGATLETHDGDDLTGNVKVRLGPVSQVYGGKATFVSRDEAEHRLVIEGTGKETRGAGTAQGKVVATLVAEAPDRTRVDVVTELAITGKAAQFGRGVMQDVASRIIDQFSAHLAALVTAVAAAAAPTPVGRTAVVPADATLDHPTETPVSALKVSIIASQAGSSSRSSCHHAWLRRASNSSTGIPCCSTQV